MATPSASSHTVALSPFVKPCGEGFSGEKLGILYSQAARWDAFQFSFAAPLVWHAGVRHFHSRSYVSLLSSVKQLGSSSTDGCACLMSLSYFVSLHKDCLQAQHRCMVNDSAHRHSLWKMLSSQLRPCTQRMGGLQSQCFHFRALSDSLP